MSKKNKNKQTPQARDRPAGGAVRENERNSLVWYTDAGGFDDLKCSGYATLAENPEVVTAVNTIARLVGSMTIYLMRNLPQGGDVRIMNEISRTVDIEPNRWMTRSNFVQWIVRTMYLEGRGNAVVWPRTQNGTLSELVPVPAMYAAFIPVGLWDGYRVAINGIELYSENISLRATVNWKVFYKH